MHLNNTMALTIVSLPNNTEAYSWRHSNAVAADFLQSVMTQRGKGGSKDGCQLAERCGCRGSHRSLPGDQRRAEAMYWQGVSRYKMEAHAALGKAADALKKRYPDSLRTTKASVWLR
jgi:hypothetical protein